eukprot:g11432.t1
MGVAEDPLAVLDSKLRVRGVIGLREIFKLTRNTIHLPQVTSGNINAPTMMIGDKAGEIIAIDYRADNASDLWEEVGNAHPMSNL